MSINPTAPCPCGSEKTYSECCKPFHDGSPSPTAESLMRSRYSAFVLGLVDYLIATHHPDTRDEKNLRESASAWISEAEWLGLDVLSCFQGGEKDRIGKVEFQAHYTQKGKKLCHHELSRFKRYKKRWFYFDGTILS